MNIFSDNASEFATKPAQAVDAERRAAVRGALAQIKGGHRGRAFYDLVRSFERQARLSGIRIHKNGDAA